MTKKGQYILKKWQLRVGGKFGTVVYGWHFLNTYLNLHKNKQLTYDRSRQGALWDNQQTTESRKRKVRLRMGSFQHL